MRIAVFALLLSGFVASAYAADNDAYNQVCESGRLRAVERADCRAQMKAAKTDQERADVYEAFDAKVSGYKPSSTPAQRQ